MQANEESTVETRDLCFGGGEVLTLIFVFMLAWTETSNFRMEKKTKKEFFSGQSYISFNYDIICSMYFTRLLKRK